MSHASAATDALRAALADPIVGVVVAVAHAREAQGALRDADDLLPVMEATANLILALEAMQNAAKRAEADARAALAAAMSLGLTQFRTQGHVVSLKAGTRGVIITDATAIPRELWTAPEPAPDKTAIGKLLRRGTRVPGAELANHCPDIVQIKQREAA